MRILNLNGDLGERAISFLLSKLSGHNPISYTTERPEGAKFEKEITYYRERHLNQDIARLFKEYGVCFNQVELPDGRYGCQASMVVASTDQTAKYVNCNFYGNDLVAKGIHLISKVVYGDSVTVPGD